jgi:hypothetical protein
MIDLKRPLEGIPGLLLLAALVLFGATIGIVVALAASWIELKDSIANFFGGVVGAGLGAALAVLGAVYIQRRDARQRLDISEREATFSRKIERAYFGGGGVCKRDDAQKQCVTDANGHRQFLVQVGNHGKTPAYMDAFEIDFCTQAEAKAKTRPDLRRLIHSDQFPPGERHRTIVDPIPIVRDDADVAFGAVYYRDIWGDPHYSRFILRIDQSGNSHSDMTGVDSYRGWD